jgi:hypothetical protein
VAAIPTISPKLLLGLAIGRHLPGLGCWTRSSNVMIGDAPAIAHFRLLGLIAPWLAIAGFGLDNVSAHRDIPPHHSGGAWEG